MTLSELRTFLAIIESGSLVRASQKLHVTQSTVTARLKTLESELGQKLLNRRKSGVSLTAAGVRFKRYAETICGLWAQATQEAALPGKFEAVLNLACHPDLWHGLGEYLFKWVQENAPKTAISVWQGSTSEMREWLAAGVSDIAISHSPNVLNDQQSIELPKDNIYLYSTNPNAPLRFDPGYVFVESGEDFGRWHAAEFADANTARLNFGSAQLGLQHILMHGGTAYLPQRVAAPYIGAQLSAIPNAPAFQRAIHLVINTPAVTQFSWLDCAIRAMDSHF